jgi:hypothetical protein
MDAMLICSREFVNIFVYSTYFGPHTVDFIPSFFLKYYTLYLTFKSIRAAPSRKQAFDQSGRTILQS